MLTHIFPQKKSTQRAQAIAEFAIVLPILLMILVGILEVGRMVFMYAAVTNASREGVRYASAVGLNNAGTVNKYNDCVGIRDMAKRSAFFVPLTTEIRYDTGPGSTFTVYCGAAVDTISISSGQRVGVQVKAYYKPLVNLIPINPRWITSTSYRTVLGILKLNAPTGGGGGGGGGGSATDTPTATATLPGATALPTDTPTLTLTPGGSVDTLTPQPTATITLLPSSTPTFTPTLTPTETETPTPTFTPTSTSTPADVCAITAGPLTMSPTSWFINVTLTNPYVDVTVSSVRLQWNAATGGTGSTELTWADGILAGGNPWPVDNKSGDYTSPTNIILPGYNATSVLTIAFDKYYENPLPNGTIITVNFSETECKSVTVSQ